MYRGKSTCKVLKEVRRKIAESNGIPLEERECTHKGDCAGTCPYCEAEVRYLERARSKRKSLGKAVAVAGIAMAAVMPAVAQTPTTTSVPDTISSSEVSVNKLNEENNLKMGELIIVNDWKEPPPPRRPEWRFPSEYGNVKAYVRREINKNPELRQWIGTQFRAVKRASNKSDKKTNKTSEKKGYWLYGRYVTYINHNETTLFLNSDGQVTGVFVFEYLQNPIDDDLIMMDELSRIFTNMPRWLHNDKDYPSHFDYESHVAYPHSLLR